MPQSNYFGNEQQISPFLMNNYNYQPEDCECACNKCHNLIPCCMEHCAKCAQANPSYYYYPYPYLVVANSQASSSTTIHTTTTTEASTTTIAPTTTNAPTTEATTTTVSNPAPETTSQLSDDETLRSEFSMRENLLKDLVYNPTALKEDNGNVIVTAMRRTKPRWMPKYGIVPIPDQIAEKLMLRIRQMKVLHPDVDTIRRTDPMYS